MLNKQAGCTQGIQTTSIPHAVEYPYNTDTTVGPSMTWTNDAKRIGGPRYLAIADAVTRAIDRGELQNGARLPTHRALAKTLAIDVTTVTRAYAEIQRRGLAQARVGQGTFVLAQQPDSPASPWLASTDKEFIDLSHNFPSGAPTAPALRELAEEVSRNLDIGGLLGRQNDTGMTSHRAAGAVYLQSLGVDASSDDVVVCAGAQHGLTLAVAALSNPGDSILTEETTFYGVRSAAAMLGRNLVGVAMDKEGLLPDALDVACRTSGARVLYCIPTLHNPTTALMGAARRKAIAQVCARHRIAVIEDDVYGFLLQPRRRPLWSDLRQHCIYLTSLSKSCAPGLRIGYMCVPEPWRKAVGAALRATTLMASPLEAEIATRLIRTEQIKRLEEAQQTHIAQRQIIAAEGLEDTDYASHPRAFHVWLRMPPGLTSEVFATEAKLRGVGVTPASFFQLDPDHTPDAVRVCLSAAVSNDHLRKGIAILAGLVREGNPWKSQRPTV
jgi:DNA-binding transcriptional MocR family regulator